MAKKIFFFFIYFHNLQKMSDLYENMNDEEKLLDDPDVQEPTADKKENSNIVNSEDTPSNTREPFVNQKNDPVLDALNKQWQTIEYYFYSFLYEDFAHSFQSFWEQYHIKHKTFIIKNLLSNLILQHIGLFNYQIYFDFYQNFIIDLNVCKIAETSLNVCKIKNLINQLVLIRIQIKKYNETKSKLVGSTDQTYSKHPNKEEMIRTVPNNYTFIDSCNYETSSNLLQSATFDHNLLYCCNGISLNSYNDQYLIKDDALLSMTEELIEIETPKQESKESPKKESLMCEKSIPIINKNRENEKKISNTKNDEIIDYHFRFISYMLHPKDKNDPFRWCKHPESRILHSAMLLSQIYPILSRSYIKEILDVSELKMINDKNVPYQLHEITDTLLLFLQTMKCFLEEEVGDRFVILLLFFTVAYSFKSVHFQDHLKGEDVFYQFYSIQQTTINFTNMDNKTPLTGYPQTIRVNSNNLMIKTMKDLPTKYKICKSWHLHSNIYQYIRDRKISDVLQEKEKQKEEEKTKNDSTKSSKMITKDDDESFLSDLKAYFLVLDKLYIKEFEEQEKKAKTMDSTSFFSTLNYNFGWSSTEKGYFTNHGIWVGPYEISNIVEEENKEGKKTTLLNPNFNMNLNDLKLYLGRILFRTRKLREWNFHYCVLKTELVIEKNINGTVGVERYWVKYELPDWLQPNKEPLTTMGLQPTKDPLTGIQYENSNVSTNFHLLNRSDLLYRLQLTEISGLKRFTTQTNHARWLTCELNVTKLMIAKILLGIGNNKLKSELLLNYHTFSFFATNLSLTRTANSYLPNSNDYKMNMIDEQKNGKSKIDELQDIFDLSPNSTHFLYVRKLLYGEIIPTTIKSDLIRWSRWSKDKGNQVRIENEKDRTRRMDVTILVQNNLKIEEYQQIYFQPLLQNIKNDQELGTHLQKLIPFIQKKLF